jgi:hypothetical protein
VEQRLLPELVDAEVGPLAVGAVDLAWGGEDPEVAFLGAVGAVAGHEVGDGGVEGEFVAEGAAVAVAFVEVDGGASVDIV